MIMHTTDRHRAHATAYCLALLLTAVLVASTAFATEPRLVPFQARLTDGAGSDLTGVYRVTFVIYDAATGGTALWSEVHPAVSVIAGRLNVLLGSLTNLDDYNGDGNTADAVKFDQPRFVGIKVGDGNPQEMVPRHQLVPAFHARTAEDSLRASHSADSDALGGHVPAYFAPAMPRGSVIMWYGALQGIPVGWGICDGTNGTPDLREKFVMGAGESPSAVLGMTGGRADSSHSHATGSTTLTLSQIPAHQHSYFDIWISETPNLKPADVDWINVPHSSGAERIDDSNVGWQISRDTLPDSRSTAPHDHGITGNANMSENRPPFVALYFIMKL